MSDADVLGILTVVLCLAASMFFSGSETAVTSMDAHKTQRLVEDGGRQGRVAAFWVRDPVRVLSTILVGNNIANTLMGAVVTALAIRHLQGGPWGGYAVGIAVFATTVLLLILGEITPKAIGRIDQGRVGEEEPRQPPQERPRDARRVRGDGPARAPTGRGGRAQGVGR